MGEAREREAVAESSGVATAVADREAELERALARDVETVRRAVRARLGSRVRAAVLGGSYGRGEGCPWERHGEIVPGPNLDVFIITSALVNNREIEETRREILGDSLVESVILNTLDEDRIARLPPTLEHADLREGHRVIDGDPSALARMPAYDLRRFSAPDVEPRLRSGLAALLEGHPGRRESLRAYYHTATSIFAGVDAFLVRNGCYAPSYREKVLRFRELAIDPRLADLADLALGVKLRGTAPDDRDAAGFWHAAARFHLDSLIGLLHPRGAYRRDRLRSLLATFHFRTTSPGRTLANLLRTLVGRNGPGAIERLLLALVIDRDPESAAVDLDLEARRAGVPPGGWTEVRDAAVARRHAMAPRVG